MDELELIQGAREGDTEAFHALFDAHSGRVFALAHRYMRNQADAEDVMQETFVRAYHALATYDPSKSRSFATWVNRICVNCSIDLLRRARHRNTRSLEGQSMNTLAANTPEDDPERVARNREIRNRIDSAIERLSPHQRMIFILRHEMGHSIRDIAQSMGSTEGSVKKHLFRAVDSLKKRLRHFALEAGYEL
ncbi:MAG: sigma-70 family RNA polymerase sigma factor [Acidobacteriota bacterium]